MASRSWCIRGSGTAPSAWRDLHVTATDAERAAELWSRGSSLSLGDRLCLVLALRTEIAAATADADWRSVAGGPELILFSRQRR